MKKIIPKWLLKMYKNLRMSKFKSKPTKDVFTKIYKSNYWKSSESISGGGSELIQTQSLRKDLQNLLNEMKIKSVLDCPCGDFHWMKQLDLSKIEYVGADIVEELIKSNSEKNNFKFIILDLIKDPLPKSDLIICRDLLVHLKHEDIFKLINNIKASGCKYLLTTTFPNLNVNDNIITGDWRPINLQIKPFNFPSPISLINEKCTEGNGKFKDKSMALWQISEI